MEAPVEIRYAGVVIGRAQEMRSADGDSPSFFLVMREPMPVGSVLRLRAGGRETPARVMHTVESPDPAVCGMQVCLIGESEEAATEWIPPPAAEKPRAAEEPAKTAMPVIEVGPPVVAAVAAVSAAELPSQDATESREAPPAAPAEDAPVEAAPIEAAPAVATEAPAVSAPPPGVVPKPEEPAVQLSFSMETAVPATAPADAAAIPEAVPTAVGSSMTGAIENAVEGASPTVEEPAAASDAGVPGEERPTSDDLPPARPIAGASGRRKTKRRR